MAERGLVDLMDEYLDESGRALSDTFGRHFSRSSQIAAERTARGWTQEELANKIGVSQSEVSRLERGVGNPTEDTWNRVADALGMRWESRLVAKKDVVEADD